MPGRIPVVCGTPVGTSQDGYQIDLLGTHNRGGIYEVSYGCEQSIWLSSRRNARFFFWGVKTVARRGETVKVVGWWM